MNGKVALITGGTSGIGKATAEAFVAAGAKVVLASRDDVRAGTVLDALHAAGGEAEWTRADVAEVEDVRAMVDFAVETFGRLDVAFNNAGSGGPGGPLAEIDEDDWARTIDGYLSSTFYCMKYELKAMLAAGGGVIVNNASVDGLRGFAMHPPYSAAKHGLVGLTKSAALQYADKSIRINAVCPAWTRTPHIEEMMADADKRREILAHMPIGRLIEPEEVAAAVVYLCSDPAAGVTGVALPVDGGYTAL